jgi:membrane protease YdiL (CAAX protease family)
MARRYNLFFAVYWLACAAVTVAILGTARIPSLFAPRPIGFFQAALLVAPVMGAFGYTFVPQLRRASGWILMVSMGRAAANALTEELFWRGLFIAFYPTDPWRGWILPALVFAAFHLVPLTVAHSPARSHVPFLAGATAIGLAYGWVAFSTGTILWTTPAHFLVDACGLDAARLALGREARHA